MMIVFRLLMPRVTTTQYPYGRIEIRVGSRSAEKNRGNWDGPNCESVQEARQTPLFSIHWSSDVVDWNESDECHSHHWHDCLHQLYLFCVRLSRGRVTASFAFEGLLKGKGSAFRIFKHVRLSCALRCRRSPACSSLASTW